ncbi:hypothetical protein G8O24_37355 [Bradyrhizobium sp. INPA01-394B]|uniref:Chromosome partition protein Smc n=2 Tax=Bradyrhizobium campsiandrae TaxID=1729892 RepID=A0ABR7U4V6_9BRAD|nr:hypothetical protein [Bradyrhizobium campsiandrae]MBC9979027.1 hypothetical protein [Bradyrhizobium campsiandrae]
MRSRSWASCLAILAEVMLLAAPSGFAQDQASQSAPSSQPSSARRAIQWSQDRLSEFDAAIASLEQDLAKRQADVRAKADATLKELRDTREAYRVKTEEAAANARTWTDAQVADARKALDERSTAFQAKVGEYLDTVKADLATRQAVLEAEFDARQKAWQKSIDELRTDASKLAAKQRADIDARIDALKAQVDEAKARVGRLEAASREAWEAVTRNYADAQQRLADTYNAIRKSIKGATQ